MNGKQNTPARKPWSWKRFGGKFLVLSVLAHLLFLTGAGYFVVQRIQAKRKLTFQAGPPSPNPATQQVEHKVQMHKETTMSAPQMVKRIQTTGMAKISLPEMPEMPTQTDEVKPMKMSGMNQGFGMGPAMTLGGAGRPGGGIALPSIMAVRCSAEGRAKSINENGGDSKTDPAVVNGLRWLKKNQNPDGTWGHSYVGGMTGLALLSFLGHCERPTSGEFGPTVKSAIDALVKEGTARNGALSFNDGSNGRVYEQGIATYALGEAYILTKDEKILPVFKKAVAMICAGQRADGGWAYGFSKASPRDPDSDTSVTCWQIQALKTAHYSGLNPPIDGVDAALDNSMKDLLRVQGANGVFGYRKAGDGHNLSGAAVFCLLMWHHAKDKAVRDGLRVIREGPIPERGRPKGAPPVYQYKDKSANLYAWYYDTQACFQAGGGAWQFWNHRFEHELLTNQSPDGSWPAPGPAALNAGAFNFAGPGTGPDISVYRTSLCILMLEVYYRYVSNSQTEGTSLQ